MRSAAILAVGVLAATATAQFTNILPTSANGTAGSTANAFPWGINSTTWPGLRIMCNYDSSHFTSAPTPVTTPILITSISWRANDTAASWAGGQYNQASVALATAAVDHLSTTAAWASNVGPDYAIVYSGPVTVLPGTGNGVGVPGPYVVTVPVNPPFLYDPNAGDLIVDTEYLFPGNVSGGLVGMDVTTVNVLARRVYSSAAYPVANGVDNAAPVIEIGYTLPGGGTVATVSSYGSGCGQQFASFYQDFTTSASFDLANTCIQMLNTGNGLVVTPGGAYNPVGSLGTPTTLALTDDSSVVAGTLGITVHSNGFVSLAAGNGNGFTPTVATMLGNPATAFYSWHDLNPAAAGSGTVKYEEAGVLAQITFDGVYDFGGTSAASANFIQFQINTATGGAVICWGTMSGAGNGHLVGYSPGGPSLNPGNSDLSTLSTTPIVTAGSDQGALSLSAIGRPVEGPAAVNFQVTTGNIPASALIHVGILGFTNPAFPLGSIGAPGCTLYSDLIILTASVGPGPLTQNWLGLNLPAAPPSNVGFQFRLQSAILGTQQNPALGLGALTSNGLLCTVGNL